MSNTSPTFLDIFHQVGEFIAGYVYSDVADRIPQWRRGSLRCFKDTEIWTLLHLSRATYAVTRGIVFRDITVEHIDSLRSLKDWNEQVLRNIKNLRFNEYHLHTRQFEERVYDGEDLISLLRCLPSLQSLSFCGTLVFARQLYPQLAHLTHLTRCSIGIQNHSFEWFIASLPSLHSLELNAYGLCDRFGVSWRKADEQQLVQGDIAGEQTGPQTYGCPMPNVQEMVFNPNFAIRPVDLSANFVNLRRVTVCQSADQPLRLAGYPSTVQEFLFILEDRRGECYGRSSRCRFLNTLRTDRDSHGNVRGDKLKRTASTGHRYPLLITLKDEFVRLIPARKRVVLVKQHWHESIQMDDPTIPVPRLEWEKLEVGHNDDGKLEVAVQFIQSNVHFQHEPRPSWENLDALGRIRGDL